MLVGGGGFGVFLPHDEWLKVWNCAYDVDWDAVESFVGWSYFNY
jgi:hypothetical protein